MHFKNIFTYLTVSVLGLGLFSCAQKNGTEASSDAISAIMSRTSIRSYQNKPVEPEKVESLLKAGMAAPTAVNRQPWHFVVVNDTVVLEALAQASPNAGMTAHAPMAIVVCGNMNKALTGNGRDFWIQDASAATENILVAANSLGLGAVWTGIYPDSARVEAVSKVLNLPANLIPLNIIPVGYPAENPAPKDKWKPENVSYNVFTDSASKAVAESKVVEELKEIDVQKRWKANPFTLFGKDWMLLACGQKGNFNAMTIGWGGLGSLWGMDRNVVTVYVRTNRYTYSFMEKNKYFTMAAFDESYRDKLQFMGSHSGRDTDKIKETGLNVDFSKLGNPIFTDAKLVLECKKLYEAPIEVSKLPKDCAEYYTKQDTAPHVMYIGEIVNAWAK